MCAHAQILCYFILVLSVGARSKVCTKHMTQNWVKDCRTECLNGFCNKLNECECNENYEKLINSNSCQKKCNPGYKRQGRECKPQCSKPCHGGRCVAPGKCSCDAGWELNEQQECVRIEISCDPPCGNGTCYEGNACRCNQGYEIHKNISPRCVQSRQSCKRTGNKICECPPLYMVQYITTNGDYCYCSKDCFTQCYKAVCAFAPSFTNVTSLADESSSTTQSNTITKTKYENTDVHHSKFVSEGDMDSQTVTKHDTALLKETQQMNETVFIFLQCIIVLGIILIVVFIVLIIRELRTC